MTESVSSAPHQGIGNSWEATELTTSTTADASSQTAAPDFVPAYGDSTDLALCPIQVGDEVTIIQRPTLRGTVSYIGSTTG